MNIARKIFERRSIGIILVVVLVLAGISFFGRSTLAAESVGASAGYMALGAVGGAVALLMGIIGYIIIAVTGMMTTVFLGLLVKVAQYNNIINVATVINGWVIVRDICNMFFILFLLIIAFATILRVESYNAKKLLPKLLIMAVLINFSRSIFGLLVDFSQVMMLTFVSSFADSAGGSFVSIFKVDTWLTLKTGDPTKTWESQAFSQWGTTMAVIATIFAAIITMIVIVVLLAVLVMRIILLWIYTILSPVIFLGFGFPPLQQYTSKVWQDFVKQLMVGPLLAFFLWLSMTTVQSSAKILSGNLTEGTCLGASAFFCQNNFQQFVIAIGLLVGGLMVTQQIGGVAGSIAGKGMNWARKSGSLGLVGAKTAGLWGGRRLDAGQMKAQKWIAGTKVGQMFGVKDYKPKSLNYRMAGQGFKKWREEAMNQYESQSADGTKPGSVWQDTFSKYFRIKQYTQFRKSGVTQEKDDAEAARLDLNNKKIEQRIENLSITEPDVMREKIEDYEKKKDVHILEYKNIAPPDKQTDEEKLMWAEEQHANDVESVGSVDMKKEDLEAQRKANQERANNLKDERRSFMGQRIGIASEMPTRYTWQHSRTGADSAIGDSEKQTMSATGGEHGAIIDRLLKGYGEKKVVDVMGCLRALYKNNNLNEALKDRRVIDLMTKSNGLLSKLAEKGKYGISQDNIEQIARSVRQAPVTPGNAQALVHGIFNSMGLNDSMAAKYANDLGEISIEKSNGLGYGIAKPDDVSGGHSFDEMKVEDGRLVASERRMAAVNGKLNNIESQLKMRTVHPDTIIAEDQGGGAAYITEMGRSFLQNLTNHDLGQIGRLRGDVLKIGRNPAVLKELKRFAEEVSETNEDQARIIKYFTGYVASRFKGGGGLKDSKDIEQAFTDIA